MLELYTKAASLNDLPAIRYTLVFSDDDSSFDEFPRIEVILSCPTNSHNPAKQVNKALARAFQVMLDSCFSDEDMKMMDIAQVSTLDSHVSEEDIL